MPVHGKLEACRQAIKEKGAIDQIVMQGIFFGLPRSGKTSTKKRLIGKNVAKQQVSTGVLEKVTQIEIEKTTVQLFSQSHWNEVADLSEEAAIVADDVTEHFTVNCDSSGNNKMIKRILKLKAAIPNESMIQNVVHKVKMMFVQKATNTLELAQSSGEPITDQENATVTADPIEVLHSALKERSVIKHQGTTLQCTLYLSDVGGQPEFQETLPALVSGPSIYFLTFPLHKGLNEKCPVEYQHPNGSSIVPFEASYTIKDVLLSSLASIASTQNYTQISDGKAVMPKVLFVATHKDRLESEEHFLDIDRELQEIVKKTNAYIENMIVFCSQDQMLFAVNNMSDSNEDIKQLRDAVERISEQSDDYKVRTPYTWMLFAITLRHLPGRVLSIDDCMKVGRECGIRKRSELNDALWYLHHNVGVIRHFQEVSELQNVVIKEPQYLFDKITELIVNTFTFKGVGPFMHNEFINKGIFTYEAFSKYLVTDSDILTSEKFAILLKHLHIIAPIEETGKIVKYFIPAALSHAKLPPEIQTEDSKLIPPILVVFKSGFCPKGMFGALIVKLLEKHKVSQYECNLKEDKIFRNQICLSIGPYDSFQLSLSPTYIKVALNTSTHHNRKIPLGQICCALRFEIEQSICTINTHLHYTVRAAHALAFSCPEPPPHDQSHAAKINYSLHQEPCTMTCLLNRNFYDLPDKCMVWFDEVGYTSVISSFMNLIHDLIALTCSVIYQV